MNDALLAAGILVVSVVLTIVVTRLKFVRSSRALQVVFLLNPGLVGVLAAATFLSRSVMPSATFALWAASLATIAVSLVALIVIFPRVLYGSGPPGQGSADRDAE